MLSVCPLMSAVEVDGINYEVISEDERTCVIREGNYSFVTGEYEIPAQVDIDGIVYTVTEIGNNAFANCERMTGLTIPETVTTIGQSAFCGCPGLTRVVIPNSVKEMSYSFSSCLNLTEVIIGSSVERMDNSFGDCCSISKVCVLNPVPPQGGIVSHTSKCRLYVPIGSKDAYSTSYYWSRFGRIIEADFSQGTDNLPSGTNMVDGLAYDIVSETDGTVMLTYADEPYKGDLVIPETVSFDGKKWRVTNVGIDALSDSPELVSVRFGEAVESVDNISFSGCNALETVIFPTNLKSIANIKINSRKLKSVVLPQELESLAIDLSYTLALPTLELPAKLKRITNLNLTFSGIASINFPQSIESVGGLSFSYCSQLTSVELPDVMTQMGESCFSNCTSLNKVKLPAGLKIIGYHTFQQCTSLTEIELPESLETIDGHAFNNSGLLRVTLPESLTHLNNGAFFECKSLEEVTVGSAITDMNTAFYGCDAIHTMNMRCMIPPTVEYMDFTVPTFHVPTGTAELYRQAYGEDAKIVEDAGMNPWDFEEDGNAYKICRDNDSSCTLLFSKFNGESLTIPSEVTNDGKNYSVTEIAPKAYISATDVKQLTIPASVVEIGQDALANSKLITDVIIEDGPESLTGARCGISLSTITDLYMGRNTDMFTSVPNLEHLTFGDTYVTTVRGFSNLSKITAVIFPESVVTISGFSGCKELTEVTFGAKTREIDGFDSCPKLTSVSFPESVLEINGFNYSGVTELRLPTALKKLSGFNSTSISTLEIPKRCTEVDGFSDCAQLTFVRFGKSVEIISGFHKCPMVTEVIFGSSTEAVSEAVLSESPVQQIYSLNPIPPQYYSYISTEPTVTVPLGALEAYRNNYPWSMFADIREADLSDMEDFDIEAEGVYADINTSDDGTPVCTITSGDTDYEGAVDLPESITVDGETYTVTAIGANAFAGSGSLTSVKLPDTVGTIGANAFGNCQSLESVSLGKGLEQIHESAFTGCDAIADVYSYSETAPNSVTRAAGNLFTEPVYSTATLHIPYGATESYMAVRCWNQFCNIEEMAVEDSIEQIDCDHSSGFNVRIIGGKLMILGNTDGILINIYYADGRCVYSGYSTEVTLSETGLYIIRIGNESLKIRI